MASKATTVWLSQEEKREFQRVCAEQGRSVSGTIRWLIRTFVKQHTQLESMTPASTSASKKDLPLDEGDYEEYGPPEVCPVCGNTCDEAGNSVIAVGTSTWTCRACGARGSWGSNTPPTVSK